jgi:tyrosyl-tRNA synthetase
MTSELIAELEWRGSISQSTDRDALLEALNSGPINFYLGFDPTAPSLHVGNLVVILVMRRFQLAGHNPIPLVGGATGLIGDPSGKNEERSLNTTEVISEWVIKIRTQLERFLDFDSTLNPALMTNNLEWTQGLSALSLLRDIGKHFSINQMLAKDSVSSRLESGGISYTEFSYQVLQGFDFLELFRRNNCTLQIGGSDQWGNIVAGLDLIRKVESTTVHAMTIPLMVKADGSKFGKTSSGTVWLDAEMTSPYAFYQFWIGTDDRDIEKYLKTFSFKSRAEIERLIDTVGSNPGAREAHKELAKELTMMVHGQDQCQKVEAASRALFGQGELTELDEETLASALSQLPSTKISSANPIPTWVDLLVATGLVESKGAARRIIKEGGGYLNNLKISGETFTPSESDFIHNRFIVLRKGKRDLAAVELVI